MDEANATPIRTLAYTVTRADVLAWAMLRHELNGWEKLRLLLMVSAAGLLAGSVPRDISPVAWWITIGLILAAGGIGAIVWSNVELRRKAAKLGILEGPATLNAWEDRLVEHRTGGTRQVDIDRITRVAWTDRHVFIREGGQPVIIPIAAFENEEDMDRFAADIDERSKRAVA